MTTMTRTDEISSVRAARLAETARRLPTARTKRPSGCRRPSMRCLADLEDRVDRREPTERWAEK